MFHVKQREVGAIEPLPRHTPRSWDFGSEYMPVRRNDAFTVTEYQKQQARGLGKRGFKPVCWGYRMFHVKHRMPTLEL